MMLGLVPCKILLVAAFPIAVVGQCFLNKAIKEPLLAGGVRSICVFNGTRLDVGSKFRSWDCLDCECKEEGLSCCGQGLKALKLFPGCRMVFVGSDECNKRPALVKDCDETRDCFTGQKIKLEAGQSIFRDYLIKN